MCQQESMCTCGVIRLESNYTKNTILLQEDVEYLKELYGRLSPTFYTRDFNLFNVYKCHVPRKMHPHDIVVIRRVADAIKHYAQAKESLAHYFLKYVEGSFTNVHFDNPNRVNKTAVTLLDVSEDLVGGDAILLKKITKEDLLEGKSQPEDILVNTKRHNAAIPLLVKQEIGSTMVYNNATLHGVTRVERGHRLVLISWFK